MSTDNLDRLLRPVLWIVFGVALVNATLLQTRLVANLDYEGENSGCESSSLHALQCVRDGRPMYPDFRQPPHVVPPYMPLFFGAVGWPARALQLGDLNMFLLGRGIVYLAWLGVAAMIWSLARQYGCTGLAVWLPPLLWLGSRVAHHWAVSVRPDALALVLSLLAVYVYRRGGHWTILWVVGLLTAAFFIKQSSVAAVVAIVVTESMCGRPRQAAWIAGVWAVLVAVGIWATQVSSGGMFLANVFFSQTTPAELGQIVMLLRASLVAGVSSFTGAGLLLLDGHWSGKDRVLKLYFLLALLVGLVGSAKAGAYTNYYLEPFAVGCVLTAIFLGTQRARLQIAWLGIALAAGGLAVVTNVRQTPIWLREVTKHGELRRGERKRWETLLTTLRALGEPVLAEDPYLAVRLSNAPFMVDLPLFAMLAGRGRFDDSALEQRLAGGGFRAVVLLSPVDSHEGPRLLPVSWLERMRNRYRLAGIFPMPGRSGLSYHVYVPVDSEKNW